MVEHDGIFVSPCHNREEKGWKSLSSARTVCPVRSWGYARFYVFLREKKQNSHKFILSAIWCVSTKFLEVEFGPGKRGSARCPYHFIVALCLLDGFVASLKTIELEFCYMIIKYPITLSCSSNLCWFELLQPQTWSTPSVNVTLQYWRNSSDRYTTTETGVS